MHLAIPRRRVVVSFAAVVAALSGCGTIDLSQTQEDVPGGAKLTVAPNAVAGQPVTVDFTGSSLGDTGACPSVAYLFLDAADGVDTTLDELKTTKQGDVCSVVDGTTKVKLGAPAGAAPGSARDQEIGIRLAGAEAGRGFESSATASVRVTVPGAPTKTTPTTTTPATTPPTGGGLSPIAVNCGPAPVEPAGFTWGFHINPNDAVVNHPVEWDARATTDSAGTITRYDWDIDGDGMSDKFSTTPILEFTPTAEGTLKTCLQATDSVGHVATHPYTIAVGPSSAVAGMKFAVSPANPKVGEEVTFTAPDVPADVTFACVEFLGGGHHDPGDYDCGAIPGKVFKHTYTAAGTYEPVYQLTRFPAGGGAPESNYWYDYLTVGVARRAAIRSAGQTAPRATAAAARKKPAGKKALTLTAPLKSTSKLVKPGKVALKGAELQVTGAVATGRLKSTLSPAKRRLVPPALKFMLDADFVVQISGKRVDLTPTIFGIAGKGKILAQAHNAPKTRVCMSFTTDGMSQPKTIWKVLGATGTAAGYVGGGLATPPLFGKGAAARPSQATLALKPGARKPIAACAALVKSLPKKPVVKKKKKK